MFAFFRGLLLTIAVFLCASYKLFPMLKKQPIAKAHDRSDADSAQEMSRPESYMKKNAKSQHSQSDASTMKIYRYFLLVIVATLVLAKVEFDI